MTDAQGSLRELTPHDRPREKLERGGASALGDNELLALLIGHGTASATALTVANRLLATARGIHGLARLSREEMAEVSGVGAAIAARVMAAVELGRRTLTVMPTPRPQLGSPREAAMFLLPQHGAHPVERVGVLLLDARYRLIRVRLLSTGSRDASLVHPREVFREAALAGASALVLFHNHPSGDATPSADDLALTSRLVSAGRVMGIDVVDHLILTDVQYYSLKEAGHL
jgi:DNA repair protein RadC